MHIEHEDASTSQTPTPVGVIDRLLLLLLRCGCCAYSATVLSAVGLRQRGISFISVGIGSTTSVNSLFLRNISTDFFRVSKCI
jgi:hypothetical protein